MVFSQAGLAAAEAAGKRSQAFLESTIKTDAHDAGRKVTINRQCDQISESAADKDAPELSNMHCLSGLGLTTNLNTWSWTRVFNTRADDEKLLKKERATDVILETLEDPGQGVTVVSRSCNRREDAFRLHPDLYGGILPIRSSEMVRCSIWSYHASRIYTNISTPLAHGQLEAGSHTKEHETPRSRIGYQRCDQ